MLKNSMSLISTLRIKLQELRCCGIGSRINKETTGIEQTSKGDPYIQSPGRGQRWHCSDLCGKRTIFPTNGADSTVLLRVTFRTEALIPGLLGKLAAVGSQGHLSLWDFPLGQRKLLYPRLYSLPEGIPHPMTGGCKGPSPGSFLEWSLKDHSNSRAPLGASLGLEGKCITHRLTSPSTQPCFLRSLSGCIWGFYPSRTPAHKSQMPQIQYPGNRTWNMLGKN